MQKFFVNNNQIKEDKIEIVGTDVNHIINVLRLRKEEEIQICNIENNKNYIASIQNYSKDLVICKIIDEIKSNSEPKTKLDIYQGLPKADKMELIIQKTIEIGVSKIIPVEMERCIVKLDEKDKQKKIDRWKKIAEVAAKQSKRDIIPKIEDIININKLCELVDEYDVFIVAYEEEKNMPIKKVLKEINKDECKVGVLIGPEGGIDTKEIEKLKHTKAKIVTLGNRILRTETAPISISSIILYELE